MTNELPSPQSLGPNVWLVDEMYDLYSDDPNSVSETWREFFADYKRGSNRARGMNTGQVPVIGDQMAAGAAPPAAAAAATPGVSAGTTPAAPASPASSASSGLSTAGTPAAPGAAAPSTANGAGAAPASAPHAPTPTASSAPSPAGAATAAGASLATAPPAELLRGVGARIVENMEASLGVPTATSVRTVPARLLEVNRGIINSHLARSRGGKVSFTHLIGFAVVQALRAVPAMMRTFTHVDGKPAVVRNDHVGFGLAVDVGKADGTRSLLVPCIREADTLDFVDFWSQYEDLIRKIRTNKISPDDFAGVTVTLTNPGTVGTVHSVPRLMPGQGVIVGVGSIGYPAEYEGADPRMLADLGVGKVVTITSTYDHRIIQGAESGQFLGKIHRLLMGDDGFYEELFESLGVPYVPVPWHADTNSLDREANAASKQVKVQTLVTMYRERGHLIADLDPLRLIPPGTHEEIDPASYGLTIWDLDREFITDGLAGAESMKLGEMLRVLRDAYCRTVGVEYTHIQDPVAKRWVQDHVEAVSFSLDLEEKRHVLGRLNAAEAFEKFLNTKYLGHKRFGLEGAESLIPILDDLLSGAAAEGMPEAVLGMAHRGRLSVLANIVGMSYSDIFREFEGSIDPDTIQGTGDVKYHKGACGKFVSRNGDEIAVSLSSNPSHLEAVSPVVEGMVRAKLDRADDEGAFDVLPILMHGDAAFAGQGVVAETLNLSNLPGYRVGGTVHVVINNQVGFTTSPEAARSTKYCTDVAKMVQAPIFHVNGDDPEACVRVARLAFAFRQQFHRDVVIDMVCYRRFGHNEADEPSYTQPEMYRAIEERRSVRKLYTEALVNRGEITVEEAERALADFQARLQRALDETRQTAPPQGLKALPQPEPLGVLPHVPTGVSRATLDRVAATLHTLPATFNVHPKLAAQFAARKKRYDDSGEVDWALGEALALGTLLVEGADVRLAGQDSGRGTFSQRHAVLVDNVNETEYVPLANIENARGQFHIYDSSLSEYAALGFEYGYSVERKDSLVLWEAQFGDFVNGAQIIIDQFLVAAEEKWGQTSGLVMLLPHGFEGQGPEHSSARIERFLTLCADDNMQVVYPTNSAQYFHVLRRQIRRDVRKPLIVFTPKSLLRSKDSMSPLASFESGSFEEILDDPDLAVAPDEVRRIVVCSGKVAYDAMARRAFLEAPVAIVRLEQMYPFPTEQLAAMFAKYRNAREIYWLQEEPANMGGALWVGAYLWDMIPSGIGFRIISRSAAGTPATGSSKVHAQEQEELLDRAIAPLPSAAR